MFEYSSKQHYTYLQWLVRFRFPPNQKSEAEDPTTGQNNNQRVWTINDNRLKKTNNHHKYQNKSQEINPTDHNNNQRWPLTILNKTKQS